VQPEDTIDLLPSEIVADVTPAHPEHSEIYKDIFGMLARGEFLRRHMINVPLERHGGKADGSAFDNTAALISAREEAEEIGANGVALPLPANPGDHFYLEGRPDMLGKGIVGQGRDISIIECVDAGAGVDCNAYGNPRQYAGYYGHFAVWGGPGPALGIATRPLVFGLLVSAYIEAVTANFADPDEGICLLLATLQNSLINDPWCVDGNVVCRFDAGAANNVILKGELAGAYDTILEFRRVLAQPLGQFAYTLYNVVQDTILEGSYASSQHMVKNSAGALNILRHVPISINGDIFGGDLPDAMGTAVLADNADGTGQSSLIVEDTKFHGGNACDVAFSANPFVGARMDVGGGSVGAVPLAFQGNIIFGKEPWYFGTVAQKLDQAGITSIIPRHERSAVDFIRPEQNNDVIEACQVIGEANLRFYRIADGSTIAGDGTAGTDVRWGRDPVNPSTFEVVGHERVTGNHHVAGNITAGGSVTFNQYQVPVVTGLTTLGNVIGRHSVHDPTGAFIGYVPIFDGVF